MKKSEKKIQKLQLSKETIHILQLTLGGWLPQTSNSNKPDLC